MTGQKPLWKYWLNLAEVTLEQAVCLSLDYDPSYLKNSGVLHDEIYLPDEFKKFSVHFVARRDAAVTHSKTGGLKTHYDHAQRKRMVKFEDFRQWGESLPVPFSFPDEFPQPRATLDPAATEPPAKGGRSPRSDNATLRIIAALLALLRDRDGGKFPSDAKVIDVLVAKYGAADGLSKRNLESVFSAANKLVAGDELMPAAKRPK